jgi:hypothetical protein
MIFVCEPAHRRRSLVGSLLLNTTGGQIDLTGWSLASEDGQNQSLAGVMTASDTVAIWVPNSFFNSADGIITLLDASGLKVAGSIYPSASAARPGWNKVA